jgi:hypothetical protein
VVVPVAARAELSVSPLAFRSRRVLHESPDRLATLSVTQGTTTVAFEKAEGQLEVKSPAGTEIESGKIRQLSRRLANVEALRWTAEAPRAEHGLAQPRIAMDLSFEGAPQEESHDHDHGHDHGDEAHEAEDETTAERIDYHLTIGAPTEGGAFARLDSGPVFVLGTETVELIEGL